MNEHADPDPNEETGLRIPIIAEFAMSLAQLVKFKNGQVPYQIVWGNIHRID